jgi:hypothetical protein
MSEQHEPEIFEETDWDMRPVVISVLVLLAFMVVGLVLGGVSQRLTMMAVNQGESQVGFETEKRLPPEPRLQVDELADMEALRTREDKLLSAYQWVNKSAGVVRIPIDRAIDVVAGEAGSK